MASFSRPRVRDLRSPLLLVLAIGLLWGGGQGASAQEASAAFRPDDTMAGVVGGYVATDPASTRYVALAFTFRERYDLGILYSQSSERTSYGAGGGILITDPDSSLVRVRAGGSVQSTTYSRSDPNVNSTTALVPGVSLTATLPVEGESGALFAPSVAFSFALTPSLAQDEFDDDLYVESRTPVTSASVGAALGITGSFGLILVQPYYTHTFSYDGTRSGFGVSLSLFAQLE